MSIKIFQVTPTKNIFLGEQAKTLDEITRDLPQGFYTTFSTFSHGTKVMGLRTHLQRLYAPAGGVIVNASVDEYVLRERIALLVRENLPDESRVRLILTKSTAEIYICIQPFTKLSENIYKNGVHVVTSDAARHDPRIKDTGFIVESAAQRNLVGRDVFEVLLTKNGVILEGMTSNFYAVKKNTLITARRGILLGVTRRSVLRIVRGQGMAIEYRAPGVNENFDEAFLTSSSRGIVPIVSINDKPVGQGKVGRWTQVLMGAYKEYVKKKSELII